MNPDKIHTHTHTLTSPVTLTHTDKKKSTDTRQKEGENTLSNCKVGVSLPPGLLKNVEPCLGFANRFV